MKLKLGLKKSKEKKEKSDYKDYFKNLLKEATENINEDNATMRELVGIKVGLEYIKQQE